MSGYLGSASNLACRAVRGQQFRADTGRPRGGNPEEQGVPIGKRNRRKTEDEPDVETVDLKKRTQKEIHRVNTVHDP